MDLSSALSIQQPMVGMTSPLTTTGKITGGDDPKLKKVCVQLEGVFMNMMIKEMRKTIDKSKLMGDSQHQQEIFQGMMDDTMSQKMAEDDKSPNGLANQLYRQLSGRKAYAATAAMPQTGTLTSDQIAQAAENQKVTIK